MLNLQTIIVKRKYIVEYFFYSYLKRVNKKS